MWDAKFLVNNALALFLYRFNRQVNRCGLRHGFPQKNLVKFKCRSPTYFRFLFSRGSWQYGGWAILKIHRSGTQPKCIFITSLICSWIFSRASKVLLSAYILDPASCAGFQGAAIPVSRVEARIRNPCPSSVFRSSIHFSNYAFRNKSRLGDRLCRPPQSSQTSALPWSIPQHSVNLIDMIRLSTSHLASDCSRKAPQPTPVAGIIKYGRSSPI